MKRILLLLALVSSCSFDYSTLRASKDGGGTSDLTGVAGSNLGGMIGTSGAAGSSGAGGSGATGTAGASGTTGTAGSTSAAGSIGTAGTTGIAGSTGTAGTNGTAGSTAGTSGTAGSTAGAGGTAGTSGAAGSTAGAGGTAGAGPPVDGCNHANWTFVPYFVCVYPTNPSCNFDPLQRLPQYAIDGDTTTRFTDGVTQMGGEYFILAFNSSIKLSGVTLIANPASNGAKAYKAEYSTDGTTFVPFIPQVAGTGGLASLPINFPAPTVLNAIKITQTGASIAPAIDWWSINEITLIGCIDQ